jgi:septal ring factor EnvC (AmiA/AmiB activator)
MHVLYVYACTQRAQLELDSMQQKCDAWKEEVEKLSPLRDLLARATRDKSQLEREVARLCQDNSRLEAELARVCEDNTGLARQLEDMESAQAHLHPNVIVSRCNRHTMYSCLKKLHGCG